MYVATEEMRFLHGFTEGRTEGFIAGRMEGYAQVLVHVLTVRFGSLPEGVSDLVYDTARRVDVDRLKTWMARTVTAKALDGLRLTTARVPRGQAEARESPWWFRGGLRVSGERTPGGPRPGEPAVSRFRAGAAGLSGVAATAGAGAAGCRWLSVRCGHGGSAWPR